MTLKPCPFCGGEGAFMWQEGWQFYVVHPACGTEGPKAASPEEAGAAWNRREPDWERKWGELVETVAARTDQAKTMEIKP